MLFRQYTWLVYCDVIYTCLYFSTDYYIRLLMKLISAKLSTLCLYHFPSQIQSQLNKALDDMSQSLCTLKDGMSYTKRLPKEGLTQDQVLQCIKEYQTLSEYLGFVFGIWDLGFFLNQRRLLVVQYSIFKQTTYYSWRSSWWCWSSHITDHKSLLSLIMSLDIAFFSKKIKELVIVDETSDRLVSFWAQHNIDKYIDTLIHSLIIPQERHRYILHLFHKKIPALHYHQELALLYDLVISFCYICLSPHPTNIVWECVCPLP